MPASPQPPRDRFTSPSTDLGTPLPDGGCRLGAVTCFVLLAACVGCFLHVRSLTRGVAPTVIDLQLAKTPRAAHCILERWHGDGHEVPTKPVLMKPVPQVRRSLVADDFFVGLYCISCAVWGWVTIAACFPRGHRFGVWSAVFFLVALAAAADWSENQILWHWLCNTDVIDRPGFSAQADRFRGLCRTKFAILGLLSVTFAMGALLRAVRCTRDARDALARDRTQTTPPGRGDFATLLDAERGEKLPNRVEVPPHIDEPFCTETEDDRIGLALSGGGIRSATFGLGLLQGLSRLGVLSHLDYLSTVSGGGYIGGWWTAWRTRSYDARRAAVENLPRSRSHETSDRTLTSSVSSCRRQHGSNGP